VHSPRRLELENGPPRSPGAAAEVASRVPRPSVCVPNPTARNPPYPTAAHRQHNGHHETVEFLTIESRLQGRARARERIGRARKADIRARSPSAFNGFCSCDAARPRQDGESMHRTSGLAQKGRGFAGTDGLLLCRSVGRLSQRHWRGRSARGRVGSWRRRNSDLAALS
jgi:hypothetical protein